jgi:hypothetical protein
MVQTREDVQWWLSPKDSPLQFSAKTERYLDLVNTSQEIVTSHTLACVVGTKGGYRVDKVFPPRKGELKPWEAFMAPKSWYERVYLAECKTAESKLAIGNRRSQICQWERVEISFGRKALAFFKVSRRTQGIDFVNTITTRDPSVWGRLVFRRECIGVAAIGGGKPMDQAGLSHISAATSIGSIH